MLYLCSSKGQNGGICCLVVQHGVGAAFGAPAEAEGGHVDGGCSRVAGQGLSFLLNYIILSGMFICLFFFF